MEPTLDHLDPDIREIVRTASVRSRKNRLSKRLWIGHPVVDDALDLMKRYASKQLANVEGIVITGPSGSGKSHLAIQWARSFSAAWDETQSRILPGQIVYIVAPYDGDQGFFLQDFARKIEAPHHWGMRSAALLSLISDRLVEMKCAGIVVDDIHNFFNCSGKVLVQAINLLRTISSWPLSTAFIGLESAEATLRSDAQADSRYHFLRLERWMLCDEYRSFLDAIERCLPLLKPSGLSGPKIAKYLLQKSEGDHRRLFRFVMTAAKAAIGLDERVTMDLLLAIEPPPRRTERRAAVNGEPE